MPAIFFLTLPPAGETSAAPEPMATMPAAGPVRRGEQAPFNAVFEQLKATAPGHDPYSQHDPRL